MNKGTIVLDIDGTITDRRSMIADEVVEYLFSLYQQGWVFIFVTGREFSFTMEALVKMPFDFYLAVQNGADLIVMPQKEHIRENYISKSCVLDLQKIYETKDQDFLVYSGFEKGDFCYFRPHRYSKERLEEVLLFKRKGSLEWVELNDFNQISQETVSMIKCIGYKKEFENIESQLLINHSLNIVMIKNPKTWNSDLLLITDYKASKCQAVQTFIHKYALKKPLIVAGDDNNDESTLKMADISIVMQTAPKHLLSMADIIAPASYDGGIIKGLDLALEKLNIS